VVIGLALLGVAMVAYGLGHALGKDAGIAQMSQRWMEAHRLELLHRSEDWQGEGNQRPTWRVK